MALAIHATIARGIEVVIVRGLPGLVNLISLFWLADKIGASRFGAYSTILATALFTSSLTFGVVSQIAVPCYSLYDKEGQARSFERSLLGMALVPAIVGFVTGYTAHLMGFEILFISSCAAITAGLSQVIQQIFQARVQIWRYGTMALTQAVIFALLIRLDQATSMSPSEALLRFVVSQSCGLGMGYLLVGRPLPVWPSARTINDVKTVGVNFSASSLAENSLFTGFRWIIAGLGTPSLLSTFSLSVDLVQRSVAVVLNLVGFTLIPRAYRDHARTGDSQKFQRELGKGALAGVAVASIMVCAVILASEFGVVAALRSEMFVWPAFVGVAAAATLNRARKVALDPVVVRNGLSWTIMAGYGIGGGLALAAAALALVSGLQVLLVPLYMCGYAAAALITLLLARRGGAKVQPG